MIIEVYSINILFARCLVCSVLSTSFGLESGFAILATTWPNLQKKHSLYSSLKSMYVKSEENNFYFEIFSSFIQ